MLKECGYLVGGHHRGHKSQWSSSSENSLVKILLELKPEIDDIAHFVSDI